jgi:hypothetical protein
LFSYVDVEARVRAAIDPAGEAVAGDAVAGVLFDPLGAASDGAAGIPSAIPLVSFTFAAAAYNLVWLLELIAEAR